MPCGSTMEPSELERAFADLKDVLDTRPVYHHTENRVEASTSPPLACHSPLIEKRLKAALQKLWRSGREIGRDISRTCAAGSDGFAGIATTYSPSRLLRVPGRAA